MAADGVSIRVDGSDAASALAGAIAANADEPRALFDEIGLSLVTSTQRRFEMGAGPDGSPWPPSYRALAGGKTLIDSARLMQSITHLASESSVEVGTNVLYAAIHQLGGVINAKTEKGLRFRIGESWVTKQSVTMPARPFLGIDADDETEIGRIAEDWLMGPAAGSGQEAAGAP